MRTKLSHITIGLQIIFNSKTASLFYRFERRPTVDVLGLYADAKSTRQQRHNFNVADADVNVATFVDADFVDAVSPSGIVSGVSNAVRQGQEEEAGKILIKLFYRWSAQNKLECLYPESIFSLV